VETCRKRHEWEWEWKKAWWNSRKNAFVCVFWPYKNGHMAEKLLEMCTLTHTLVHTHQYTHTHTQKLLEASAACFSLSLSFSIEFHHAFSFVTLPKNSLQFSHYKLMKESEEPRPRPGHLPHPGKRTRPRGRPWPHQGKDLK